MSSNIFIPYTAYNTLLAFALSAEHPEEENIFIFSGPMMDAGLATIENLRKLAPPVRVRVLQIPYEDCHNNLSRFFAKKRELKILRSMCRQFSDVSRIYYFEEWYIITHLCLSLAEKLFPDVQLYQVEDGIETYVKLKHKVKNIFECTADNIFYGSWHSDVKVPGTLRKRAAICALFPELLPNIFDGKDKIVIKSEILKRQIEKHRDSFIEALHLPALTGTGNTLITVDDEKYVDSPAYKAIVASHITAAQASNSRVAVKMHPGDRRTHDFGVGGGDLVVLPPRLPVEIYYLLYSGVFSTIVGGLSTCLLTARWLLPEASISSVFPEEFLDSTDYSREILSFYEHYGIRVARI